MTSSVAGRGKHTAAIVAGTVIGLGAVAGLGVGAYLLYKKYGKGNNGGGGGTKPTKPSVLTLASRGACSTPLTLANTDEATCASLGGSYATDTRQCTMSACAGLGGPFEPMAADAPERVGVVTLGKTDPAACEAAGGVSDATVDGMSVGAGAAPSRCSLGIGAATAPDAYKLVPAGAACPSGSTYVAQQLLDPNITSLQCATLGGTRDPATGLCTIGMCATAAHAMESLTLGGYGECPLPVAATCKDKPTCDAMGGMWTAATTQCQLSLCPGGSGSQALVPLASADKKAEAIVVGMAPNDCVAVGGHYASFAGNVWKCTLGVAPSSSADALTIVPYSTTGGCAREDRLYAGCLLGDIGQPSLTSADACAKVGGKFDATTNRCSAGLCVPRPAAPATIGLRAASEPCGGRTTLYGVSPALCKTVGGIAGNASTGECLMTLCPNVDGAVAPMALASLYAKGSMMLGGAPTPTECAAAGGVVPA
jgi:hypothetical protein